MRKIKAGKRGQASKYVSRAKAIRKLQLSLKDFRRMCILKGVYPREPPKKLKKHGRTYYHSKDINFLALDPLISRFRQQKVYLRKCKRAKVKGDTGQLRYLLAHKPKVSLDHLVRERYPDFIDALRDLDDPLSLLALFALFPSHRQFNLSVEKAQASARLLRHFELYLMRSHSLKKAFVSIKGIYYQAEVLGQTITYVVPYRFPPQLPLDVDYRVMCSFLDFYLTLLKFVNFKLYSSIGLQYPPAEPEEEMATSYSSYILNPVSVQAEEEDDRYKLDEEFALKNQEKEEKLLFTGFHFYLSTEVPRQSLEFVIISMGGKVTFNYDAADLEITHVVTDREKLNIEEVPTKEYIQPQWVYDCINFGKILNVKEYWHNSKELPPHLSPFLDEKDEERYIPEREKELRGLQRMPDEQQQEEVEDQYDVELERRREKKRQLKEQKETKKISQSVISNKNKKLMKAIAYGKAAKQKATQKLRDKAKTLKSK